MTKRGKNMISRISERGQTVIPKAIREKLGLTPGSRLEWLLVEGVILVLPAAQDPIKEAAGMLKGGRASTRSLLRYRAEDKALELKR